MSTPFGDSTQQYQQSSKVDAGNGVAVTASSTGTIAKSKSYKLVKSSTGSNLYVENAEYDPLEHHRKRDKKHDKGEGLGFMFCCWAPKVEEPAHTAERHYSMEPNDSMTNQVSDKTL